MLLAAGAAHAADPPRNCSSVEYRQFDFWIGGFEVRSPDGELAGHNVIEPTLNGCALTEHRESSTDDGATWMTLFDGCYLPKR